MLCYGREQAGSRVRPLLVYLGCLCLQGRFAVLLVLLVALFVGVCSFATPLGVFEVTTTGRSARAVDHWHSR